MRGEGRREARREVEKNGRPPGLDFSWNQACLRGPSQTG